ncbi:hypothetical protein PRIPAC_92453 [Pristionchus pacificus]|uniref:Uncharacterized protein n=1 Tax=Pristionchus pacificus TaxID=54126 RepID=A0A2A6B9V0_PRIPA|nr:hypothetical protein PRIPAC_92453 [Pristionchus pacificus]|eukprot:PDM62648.1 hypothetical protein PRIPAC_49863 [Pristionchus pacificus]
MKLLQANEENTLRASGEREQGKARDWAVVNNVTEKTSGKREQGKLRGGLALLVNQHYGSPGTGKLLNSPAPLVLTVQLALFQLAHWLAFIANRLGGSLKGLRGERGLLLRGDQVGGGEFSPPSTQMGERWTEPRALLAVVAVLRARLRRRRHLAVLLQYRYSNTFSITLLPYHLLVRSQALPLAEATLAHVAVKAEPGVPTTKCLRCSWPGAAMIWADSERTLSKSSSHTGQANFYE